MTSFFHRSFFLLLVATLGLLACTPRVVQRESFVFGTRVEVTVAAAPEAEAQAAITEILREFDRLHRQYHAWQDSELTALNLAIALGQPYVVSEELSGLIQEAQSLAAQGDYLFDPGIGKLIALWGFQSDEFKPTRPETQQLTDWQRHHPSIADLSIERKQRIVSGNRQVALDFGGYLKGWALDRAAAILRRHQIGNALINIGGNILALGNKNGSPWRVGIQHPRTSGTLATIELQDGEAIGTSGDYQRFFELDGQRFPHLLDPRTAHPAQHTQAVTILIPSGPQAGTLSDAGSKPIFIAGPDGWVAAARKMGIVQVLRVDAHGEISASRVMAQRLGYLTKNLDLTIVEGL